MLALGEHPTSTEKCWLITYHIHTETWISLKWIGLRGNFQHIKGRYLPKHLSEMVSHLYSDVDMTKNPKSQLCRQDFLLEALSIHQPPNIVPPMEHAIGTAAVSVRNETLFSIKDREGGKKRFFPEKKPFSGFFCLFYLRPTHN